MLNYKPSFWPEMVLIAIFILAQECHVMVYLCFCFYGVQLPVSLRIKLLPI